MMIPHSHLSQVGMAPHSHLSQVSKIIYIYNWVVNGGYDDTSFTPASGQWLSKFNNQESIPVRFVTTCFWWSPLAASHGVGTPLHLSHGIPTPSVYLPPDTYPPPGREQVPEIPTPRPEQTHTCENITSFQLRWRAVTDGLQEI